MTICAYRYGLPKVPLWFFGFPRVLARSLGGRSVYIYINTQGNPHCFPFFLPNIKSILKEGVQNCHSCQQKHTFCLTGKGLLVYDGGMEEYEKQLADINRWRYWGIAFSNQEYVKQWFEAERQLADMGYVDKKPGSACDSPPVDTYFEAYGETAEQTLDRILKRRLKEQPRAMDVFMVTPSGRTASEIRGQYLVPPDGWSDAELVADEAWFEENVYGGARWEIGDKGV